jgi:methyl-accepting chemotaxis protein
LHVVRRLAALAVVLALAGVAAGCGGDDDADPTAAWASDFCSAITGWTDELEGITSDFTDASNLSQEGLQSAAEDARTATQDLVDELRGLGAPPTESGDEIESTLDDLSTTLEQETTEIEQTAEGVSNLTELPDAIQDISGSLAAMATAFSSALTAIQESDARGELQTALEDSPECADISSS